MKLYRAMIADSADGLPQVGRSARMLGVRTGDQAPHADVGGMLPTDTVQLGGRMSVAPDDPMHLAKHRRPAALGGTGNDPVWAIDSDDLGPDLAFARDRVTHGFLTPARPMTLAEFEQALVGTRGRWVRVAG